MRAWDIRSDAGREEPNEPHLRVIPKIVVFLGYKPELFSGLTIGQRLKKYRQLRGISQKEPAQLRNKVGMLEGWSIPINQSCSK